MTIERTEKEILIRISSDVSIDGVQEMLDYITYKENISKSKASQEEIDELIKDIKKDWWKNNKERLLA